MDIKADLLGLQLFQSKFDNYDPKLTKPIENKEYPQFVKPKGGVWTSSYTPAGEYESNWLRFCSRETYLTSNEHTNGLILKPSGDCKITEINCQSELRTLVSKYGRWDEGKDRERPRYITNITDIPSLDFEKMAKDYDGIHLTEEGQWRTRFGDRNLYGWDAESTLWFNPHCLKQVDTIDLSDFCGEIAEEINE